MVRVTRDIAAYKQIKISYPDSGNEATMTDKFITPSELPTPREQEILVILIEEAAEVQQRATKALRFGLPEIQPEQDLTNRTRLSEEIGDMLCTMDMAFEEGVIERPAAEFSYKRKEQRLEQYMQTKPR